jgi:Calcineurin-like phosphoesterase
MLVAVAAALAVAAPANADPIVWAVGDGAVAGGEDDALAARVAESGIDRFLYLGDVYETGTAQDYAANYDSSWGRFKAITHPTPGNHEWDARAEGYDPYWGARAPLAPGGGHYYSFDLLGWHFVSLNSHEDSGPRSNQSAWLERDLSAYDGTCTIGFHHRPRYSAGHHGDAPDVEPLYARLAGHAIALLSGHDHDYQRMLPERGLVQFVVGSGGRRPLNPVNVADARLAAYDDANLGALRLELASDRAGFRFVRADGTEGDAGVLPCRSHSPSVAFATPRPGARRRVVSLAGSTRLAGGPVKLTLIRRVRRRCHSYDGRRFRPGSCRTRRSVLAEGVARWRYRLRGPLPRGRYLAVARVDGYGSRGGAARLRFTVR